jgi:hypothetical protein
MTYDNLTITMGYIHNTSYDSPMIPWLIFTIILTILMGEVNQILTLIL